MRLKEIFNRSKLEIVKLIDWLVANNIPHTKEKTYGGWCVKILLSDTRKLSCISHYYSYGDIHLIEYAVVNNGRTQEPIGMLDAEIVIKLIMEELGR